jgi:hypothetical protein
LLNRFSIIAAGGATRTADGLNLQEQFLKLWYSCKAGSAFDLRLAAEMSSSDGTIETSDAARRRRRRSNTLLLVLAVGFLIFGAAAGALYYALQPVILRIAVGPPSASSSTRPSLAAGVSRSASLIGSVSIFIGMTFRLADLGRRRLNREAALEQAKR